MFQMKKHPFNVIEISVKIKYKKILPRKKIKL